MKSIIILPVLLMVFTYSSFSWGKKKDYVAEVNGEKILKPVFDQTFRQNQLFLSNKKVTKQKVITDLINRRLGIQKAKKEGLGNNPLVMRKMEDVLYHAQVSKDLEPLLKKIKVSDSDVKNYYSKNKEYRTAHILFRVSADPDKSQVKAAMDMSQKIYKEAIKNPDKFAELANKYTQSTTAPNGGDLGFQPPPRLAPEYFAAINGKKPGFISKPVRTQFGFHIVKIHAVKDFKDINKELYKKIIYDVRRDKVLAKYFSSLRRGASIQIYKNNL